MISDTQDTLIAAASSASAAVTEMIEEAREGYVSAMGNIGSGEALEWMADSLRLVIECRANDLGPDAARDEIVNQLHGALVKFLEDRP